MTAILISWLIELLILWYVAKEFYAAKESTLIFAEILAIMNRRSRKQQMIKKEVEELLRKLR